MAISQQVLKRIEIQQLKGLNDLEIDFEGKQLTAILGPNGVGKSTIIHALSCINKPVTIPSATVNHRLSEFFTPTTHSIWTGSSFHVIQDYRDGPNLTQNHRTQFRKQQSRWAPRYVSRIERYISFIGIRTCVPIIESENQQARIQFNTTPLTDNISNKIRNLAGVVMNRDYTNYNNHRTASNKNYIGVTTNGINYSSLSMGAGEQRIFYILGEVLKAPNHGMIIIDEIDLLLHQDALIRLLNTINDIAVQKNLQIIFTTHSHSILSCDFINFRHLLQTPTKTLCFNETKPGAMQRLTGLPIRSLEVFVEDDLAHSLIKKISAEEGISQHVSIKEFGAAINCFTTAGGAILNDLENLNNMLFVLDGDIYKSIEEQTDNVNRVLTGNTPALIAKRVLALSKISQFSLPDNQRPEQYYHSLICSLNDSVLTPEQIEIVQIARQIVNPDDTHKFLDDIIFKMDYLRPVGLSKLVDLISLSDQWINIKSNIKDWLVGKKAQLVEE